MSTVYAPPPETAYLTMTPFDMPGEDGDVWAVALSTSSSQFLNAAIAVVFTLIFPWAWGLIASIALYAAPHKPTRRQSVALVTLRNAPDPWTAFKALLGYTYESMGSVTANKRAWREPLSGLVLCLTSLAVFVVSIVMGIVGPTLLEIGNVAPVRASILYYPQLPPVGDTLGENIFNGHRSLGILRALSSVEIAKAESRSKVKITVIPVDYDGDEQPPPLTFGLQYNYHLSGADFGIERASGLALNVTGECRTTYAWQNTSDPEFDIYTLWGDETNQFSVSLNGSQVLTPPRAYFWLPMAPADQLNSDGRVSFAVVVAAAHRPSISEGSDPWYTTEQRDPDIGPELVVDTPVWVKRGRPALSCWQHDRWSYGDQEFKNVVELANAPNDTVPVPSVLLKVIASASVMPLIISVANIVGPSALESAVISPNGFNNDGLIDAGAASIQQDMERLIVASFINTRNILVDCAMSEVTGNGRRLANVFTGTDGRPQDGAGQFVVSTPNVRTFSLNGLIGLAVTLVGLLFLKIALFVKLLTHADAHTDGAPGSSTEDVAPNCDRWARFKALSAGSLLRMVYEGGRGVPQPDWKCCEEFPTDDPNGQTPKRFQLAKCQAGACSCGGHIVANWVTPPADSHSGIEHNATGDDDKRPVVGNEEVLPSPSDTQPPDPVIPDIAGDQRASIYSKEKVPQKDG
ncbi:hypothetical protein MFIFM68171_10066 [Madurella fahalii]|uniref:Uncharacterized protein n=1 Tax=Madurella fahalii TaxID=1157608 RepID=A0ABQ0GQ65_9PEZI